MSYIYSNINIDDIANQLKLFLLNSYNYYINNRQYREDNINLINEYTYNIIKTIIMNDYQNYEIEKDIFRKIPEDIIKSIDEIDILIWQEIIKNNNDKFKFLI
jgi:hypothetical protein